MKKYIYSFVFIFAFLFLFGNVISFANEDLDIHKKKEYIVSYDLNLKKEKMNKNVLKKKNENIRKK